MKVKLEKGIVKLEGKVKYAERKSVTKFGNGAKIDFYKRFKGEDVLVLVLENR